MVSNLPMKTTNKMGKKRKLALTIPHLPVYVYGMNILIDKKHILVVQNPSDITASVPKMFYGCTCNTNLLILL